MGSDSQTYYQLERTLRDVLLCEPGSSIEGPTEDVLRVVFEATWRVLREQLGDDTADQVALRHLRVAHQLLTQEGFVVRIFPGDD
jgi:hypothetical protein